MNYFISRDLNEYGPYSLADLQRYVASGNISTNDLARSEGMTDWVPVSQIIGNIPVPATIPTAPTAAPVVDFPSPPALHWALVLLLAFVSCGLFAWAWIIVQAAFVKKIEPTAKSLYYIIGALSSILLSTVINMSEKAPAVGIILYFGGLIVLIVGMFVMRSELEDHYNNVEPIGLQLSAVMTFFFALYYFQYHFSRIAQLKKSRQLSVVPQGA